MASGAHGWCVNLSKNSLERVVDRAGNWTLERQLFPGYAGPSDAVPLLVSRSHKARPASRSLVSTAREN